MTIDAKSTTTSVRTCGSCSLCCKLVAFAEIDKPTGQWCRHCTKNRGCGIYDTRPDECRSFNCVWLTNPEFGDEWEPTRSKMVISHVLQKGVSFLVVHVDSGSSLSWQKEPYNSELKKMARRGFDHDGWINIIDRNRLFVASPTGFIHIGIFDPTDEFNYEKRWNGRDWEIAVFKNGTRVIPE